MCGRYRISGQKRDGLHTRFQTTIPDLDERINVCPTEDVPVVRSEHENRHFEMMRWGLIQPWVKDLKGKPLINARAETLLTTRSFTGLVQRAHSRCLLLASGFYEWQKLEDPKQRKTPILFTVDGEQPFTFAGLWSTWTAPDGASLATCTLITCEPNRLVAPIHNRMPAILSGPGEEDGWLNSDDVEVALHLLGPLDPARMSAEVIDPDFLSAQLYTLV